ncbi:hypothetical protein FQA39_LY12985 [Lamprigera yunnana]|nr:hypothetical protein FQA39_LY12985 [Lamprigera yunnana]
MYLDGTEAIYLAMHEHHINDITFIVNPSSRTDLNLSLIEHIYKNNIKVISDDSEMYLLDKGENILSFEKYKEYNYISIFPLYKTSFTIKNLKYNVNDLEVDAFSTTTFSNAFVKNGDGVVINSEPCVVIFNKMITSELKQVTTYLDPVKVKKPKLVQETRSESAKDKLIKVLQTENTQLKARVVELEAEIVELKAEIVELKAENAQLKAEIVELKAKNAEQAIQISELMATNAELMAMNKALLARLDLK